MEAVVITKSQIKISSTIAIGWYAPLCDNADGPENLKKNIFTVSKTTTIVILPLYLLDRVGPFNFVELF